LDVRFREQAKSEDRVKAVAGASVVFFTGGDQLKITSQLGRPRRGAGPNLDPRRGGERP
jgi:cyanophycinase-like exopeptidase